MRGRADHGRDLRARGGECARIATAVRSLSPGPFWAETGEREPGSRLTHRRFRFARDSRASLFNEGARRGSDRSTIVLTFSPDRLLNSAARPPDHDNRRRGERFATLELNVPARAPAMTVRTPTLSHAASSRREDLRESTIARTKSKRSCASVLGGRSPRSMARVTINLHSSRRSSTASPMIASTSGLCRSSSSRAHARPSIFRPKVNRRLNASTRSLSSCPVSGSGLSRRDARITLTRAAISAARLGQRR
jgi:hypothetical protein